MGAADASGLVVSYIQSLYWGMSAPAGVLPGDRLLMQNRGAQFSLQSGALNPLMPGRLPSVHHSIRVLRRVCSKTAASWPNGCHGRRTASPQTQSALFTRYVDVPRTARRRHRPAPRWCSAAPGAHRAPALRLEPALRRAILSRRTWPTPASEVEVLDDTYSRRSWATPAPWCCTRTVVWKAPYDPRARLAGRRECDCRIG